MYKSIVMGNWRMIYNMKDKRDYFVAVDFDGTLFEHKYPAIGKVIIVIIVVLGVCIWAMTYKGW